MNGQLRRLIRVSSAALVIGAIVAQAGRAIEAGVFDPTRFFAYFTIQSNLIGVAAVAWLALRRDGPRSRPLELLRGAAAVYLTVTFVVVILLLSNVDVGLQLPWVDFVLHKMFPVVVVADWLLDGPHHRLAFRDDLLWLVYPLLWTVCTVIRGALDGWYPYPFLDPAQGGYGSVALVVTGIMVVFFALSGACIWVGNRRTVAKTS